ncbi:MAG: accessory factor UbiK family protein [Rhodospirillales bacterium]|nr:accessory factor UbiK family protein [Rhodospirillales bacterium]
MIEKKKILDDAAMIAGGVLNLVSAGRDQVRREVRLRADSLATKLDLVPREDFERLEALLVRTREEQESLKKRLEALEKPSSSSKIPPQKPSRSRKKT